MGSFDTIPTELLRYDPKNPRLVADDEEELTQEECAERLYDDFDPISIGRSLAAFGFFPTDPLIGRKNEDGTVTVYEGNRRLLAVRLLTDPDLREALDAGPEWHVLSRDFEQSKVQLDNLPVWLVDSWEEAAPVIGVRHIVGIEKWKAYEKAAFVRKLLVPGDLEEALDHTSKVTGEAPGRLRRYLRDYMVIEQAETVGIDIANARDRFGAFTRLMSDANVGSYIDLVPPSEVDPDEGVAYRADSDTVRQLFSFAFGTDDVPPVITDSRRYDELGAVLNSKEALRHLEMTRDIEESLALTGEIRERVVGNLLDALKSLERAGDDIERIDIDDAIEGLIDDIGEVAGELRQQRRPSVESDRVVADEYDLDLPDEDEDLLENDDS